MKEEIYVLVLVSYKNEIRQQNNLFIGTEEECIKKVSDLFTNNPIYTYKDKDTALALELDYREQIHYWLQKF